MIIRSIIFNLPCLYDRGT